MAAPARSGGTRCALAAEGAEASAEAPADGGWQGRGGRARRRVGVPGAALPTRAGAGGGVEEGAGSRWRAACEARAAHA